MCLHLRKKLKRAGHAPEASPRLRARLGRVFEIYDGSTSRERFAQIEAALGPEERRDLLGAVVTETMVDGLLRPGEILPKRGHAVNVEDVEFDFFADGRLKSATVHILPIKLQGKKVGNTSKVPIVIKAHRQGNLRSAELLHIFSELRHKDANKGDAFFCQWRGYRRSKRLTQAFIMNWYHTRAEEAGVPHHTLIKPHSFRIAGATILMAAGFSQQTIKNMGRWASDVYLIYSRACKHRLLEISEKMAQTRTDQWLGREDGFFDQETGVADASSTTEEDIESEGEDSSEEYESDDDDDADFEP